ncbi:phosphotransferase [Temperatibacter marinus]|uniref:Phosphotransferase n=1 Tax=Temperatibacter marinus TaxID=1456591 RepID=A0AA52EED5_9PROT|nr:phosphotransferase [Temperatibacter marinus]WND03932.1 phosphotransferase [Temperatibacter marinus]
MTQRLREKRDQIIDDFLQQNGMSGWQRKVIAGDASFRRYERLKKGEQSLILMDAPPPIESVIAFLQVTDILQSCGSDKIITPKIIAKDEALGLLVLSDFGSDVLKKAVEGSPEREKRLYLKAISILSDLHKEDPAEALPEYDEALYHREVSLFADWYMPAIFGDYRGRDAFFKSLEPALKFLSQTPFQKKIVLRDYHAENLMVLEADHLGQLDYQDAVIGHPAYDLVSLTQDARRIVSPDLEEACLRQYLSNYTGNEQEFRTFYAILGAQRSLKIIGIFYRLFLRDQKEDYLPYISHVWQMVERNLQAPILKPLRDFLEQYIPQQRRKAVADSNMIRDKFPIGTNAMIMAAGKGTRMGELSHHTPKPLVQVNGISLLDRAMDHCFHAGVQRVVVNVHHLASQIETALENRPIGPQVLLSDEREALLETGGGVMKALPLLGKDPFYVINSDALWIDTGERQLLQQLAADFDESRMDICLAVMRVEEAPGYDGVGDLFFNEVSGEVELRGNAPSASHMFAGVRLMKATCFDGEEIGQWSMRRLFRKAEAKGRLFGSLYKGTWLHVGDPDARNEADNLLKKIEG